MLRKPWPPSQSEPPRVFWRLHILRGWSHEHTKEVSTGVTGKGNQDGVRPLGTIRAWGFSFISRTCAVRHAIGFRVCGGGGDVEHTVFIRTCDHLNNARIPSANEAF